nr:hypothetical protein [Tanacetum cinerariifolium]
MVLDFIQVVSAAKLPILNPNKFDLWKMRIDQYFLMTDYSLWEVILNGDSQSPTRVFEGVLQPVAPTMAEQRLARKNELKAREGHRRMSSVPQWHLLSYVYLQMIRKQVGDLLTHTTKYTSPALTQKVFANMRRVGKAFFRVETPLFESMVVAQEVGERVADELHDEGVPTAGIVAEGDVSAANDEVPTVNEEPSIPSPTPPTPPPQPSHDIPSTSQAQPRPPQSTQV